MTEQMNITIEKTEPNAIMPAYGTDGAACFDLFSCKINSAEIAIDGVGYQTLTIHTGLKFDIPDGWVMRLYSRSGHGFKFGVRLCNSTGIIDSDYEGEVLVKLRADDRQGAVFLAELCNKIQTGNQVAVCQGEIAPVEYVSFEFGTIEPKSKRGAGGFGSTDKAI
ncbi:deoxyuridine 5'-triphosphate nucleotidohydrolase [Pantoea phage vB_PagM_AAM37]|uniref:dUTP diphosphatase n=1 Tax=Pantoea phage vB_PagM_AAM37 TaxID=2588093 RepID=A0A513ZYG2_9CAUD|nr:deoxyuridine 5'-triphosphate nucleotidohydrolase [Pantoea phage vB_PagM_AAM37]QDH45711.1 deoxyuridine 5'-triphosphate nucleotidohydrolase [Pantoea phage vB_PagM_AAM37]